MFYEVIYENGDSSIMSVDSEEEALEGLKEAHRRAMAGEKSLQSDPASPPASRVKRVLKYDEHPGNFGEDFMVKASELSEAVKALTDKGGMVDSRQMVELTRSLSSATIDNPAPHESKYQMKESGELDPKGWEGV